MDEIDIDVLKQQILDDVKQIIVMKDSIRLAEQALATAKDERAKLHVTYISKLVEYNTRTRLDVLLVKTRSGYIAVKTGDFIRTYKDASADWYPNSDETCHCNSISLISLDSRALSGEWGRKSSRDLSKANVLKLKPYMKLVRADTHASLYKIEGDSDE